MDGYQMIDEDGKRSGYEYDLLQKLSRYLPYTFEYVGYDKSWSVLAMVNYYCFLFVNYLDIIKS